MKIISLFSILFLFIFIYGCGSSQQTTQVEIEEEYVFDDIPPDSFDLPEPETPTISYELRTYYVVQIGAFNTLDAAEEFAVMSMQKLDQDVHFGYSSAVGLYIVQLTPFETRKEAEQERNRLWKMQDYKDAFILTVEK